MSKLNFLVFLNTYSDPSASNNPSLSNFKWNRDVSGLPASNPLSEAFSLAPAESKDIFNGSRTLLSDNTTTFSIALKPLSSQTYVLTATAGTLPNFRTPRAIATDATSEVTVTVNGPLAIFTFTAGTLPNLASVVVGDYVRIGDQFNQLSRGEFKILAKTSTSFTIENQVAAAEGPIVLGATFADQIMIYSAAGVQVGDTIVISSGFSAVTQGAYKVTSVGPNFLEFYSTNLLPQESGIVDPAINIYYAAKTLIYIETNQKVNVVINGTQTITVDPIITGVSRQPGILMLTHLVYSLSVTSQSTDTASLFLASVE